MSENIYKSALDGAIEYCGEVAGAEEVIQAGNSFFDRSYFGTRILILAPAPGDEILIAGNALVTFAAAKAEIYVAYRSRKNFSSDILKNLGVKSDKIIFFASRAELKKILLELQANVIFCADFDSQAEYKNLSADFEEVLCEILHAENYRPEVYKKFACATALNAPPDFYAPNLISTVHPKLDVTDNYKIDLIDRANYAWANRVRFPVPELCQKTLLKENPLAKAILAYKNFRPDFNAIRILNGDEVFFERRTDNQLMRNAQCVMRNDDGVFVECKEIADFAILESAKSAEFIIEWQEGVQVQQVVIYGNWKDSHTARLEIVFELDSAQVKIMREKIISETSYKVEKILPAQGLPLIIDTEKIFVRRAVIKVLECGENFGLGEVEFFANKNPRREVQPFIKLTAGENFFYELNLPAEVEKISLGVYKFHVDEPVRILAEAGDEKIFTQILSGSEEFVLNFGAANEIILTASAAGGIYDRAIIRRVGDLDQIQFKMFQWFDKLAKSLDIK